MEDRPLIKRIVQCGARLDAAIDYVYHVMFVHHASRAGEGYRNAEDYVRLNGSDFEILIDEEEGAWIKSGYRYDKERQTVWKRTQTL